MEKFKMVQVRGKVKIADTSHHMDLLYRAITIQKRGNKTEIFIPRFNLTLWVDNWYIEDIDTRIGD